jgi:hypothetical protein
VIKYLLKYLLHSLASVYVGSVRDRSTRQRRVDRDTHPSDEVVGEMDGSLCEAARDERAEGRVLVSEADEGLYLSEEPLLEACAHGESPHEYEVLSQDGATVHGGVQQALQHDVREGGGLSVAYEEGVQGPRPIL